jgi:hypothetical protein
MHTAVPQVDLQATTEKFLERVGKRRATFGVQRTHPLDVPRELPGHHEVGHDRLGQRGAIAIEQLAQVPHAINSFRWHDDIAEPQAGEEHLTEAADIEDTSVAIHARQRWQRRASIPELAVVVILDDPRTRRRSPCEQRTTSSVAERRPEWRLMRRRDVRETGVRRSRYPSFDHQPVVVHRYGHDPRASGLESQACHEIARILAPHFVARCQKSAGDLQRQIQAGQQRLNDIQTTHKQLREREGRLKQLTVYRDYNELDWQALTLDIQRLDDERRALEAASDVLRTLQAQLVTVDEQLNQLQQELDGASASRTVATTRRGDAEKALADVHTLLAATPEEAKTRYFPQLESMRPEALSDQKLTVESCDNRQSDMREWLQKKIDAEDKKLARLRDSIIDAMRRYKIAWPIDQRSGCGHRGNARVS